jgi:hypothetical protein
MKVYITTYALSKGIYAVEVDICDTYPKLAFRTNDSWETSYHKPHWHETIEEAQAQAETMRVNKITSLKKQLVKLESLRFDECKDSGL